MANELDQKIQQATQELTRIDQITKQIQTYNPQILPGILKQQIERLRSELITAEKQLRAAEREHKQLSERRELMQADVAKLTIIGTTLKTLRDVAIKWTNVLNEFTSVRIELG
jgi:uncharacterized coiled-coil DUF342 family protein